MCVVGNRVCQIRQLPLQRRLTAVEKTCSYATRLLCFQLECIAARAVLETPLRVSKLRLRPSYCGVALFQLIHHTQALQIVLKAAKVLHAGVQLILTSMPEWGVSEIMRQANGFDQGSISSSGRAMDRPSCATSSECVRRVRNRSPSWFTKTCVL